MRSILLLAAAAMGLLCALGKPSESVETPIEPGSFQAWNDAEIARLEASQAIHTASAPVKATSREAETPAEPADELEIAPWEEPQPLTIEQFRALQELLRRNPNATQEDAQAVIDGTEIVVEEPPDESPPTIKWEGAPPEQVNGVWHRRSKMIVPPELDAGEALPQPGDKTMSPEYLDRPGVIDGRTQPSAAYGSKVCPCGNCQCGPDCQCPKGTVLTPDVGLGRLPRLRVTVWDQGCAGCNRFKSEAMPELGWSVGGPESQIEIVTVPGNLESSPPAPLFEYVTSAGVESWVGYESRDDFMSRLRRAMDLPFEAKTSQGATGYRVENPVPGDAGQGTDREGGGVSSASASERHDAAAPGWHSHRCDGCGRVWSHDANALTDHYAAHCCPDCGQYQNVHWEGGGQPAMQTRGTYYAPSTQQRGFIGRLLFGGRGGCANGACGH